MTMESSQVSFLSKQPPEVIEEIIDNLERPNDLLQLALASRQFAQQIVPSHLEYREIICEPGFSALWKHLASIPGLARNTRVLALRSCSQTNASQERHYSIPRELFRSHLAEMQGQPSTNEPTFTSLNFSYFTQALKAMCHLTSFSLYETRFCPGKFVEEIAAIIENYCGGLRCLTHQMDRTIFEAHMVLTRSHFALWRLSEPNITTLSLLARGGIDSRQTEEEIITAICLNYPKLQSLALKMMVHGALPQNIYLLFQLGNWPQLVDLRLEWYGEYINGPPQGASSAVSAFFRRHTKLHTLTIPETPATTQYLSDNTFHCLRRLSLMQGGHAPYLLTYPRSMMRSNLSRMFPAFVPKDLTFLSCEVTESCLPYFYQMRALRFLLVSMDETLLERFLLALEHTQVERVELTVVPSHCYYTLDYDLVKSLLAQNSFPGLAKVTHLDGLFSETRTLSVCDSGVLPLLLKAMPCLTFLNMEGKWFKLTMDGNDHHFTEEKGEHLDGDIFKQWHNESAAFLV